LAAASGGWNSTEATVLANSADWADHTDISDLAAASGDWNDTRSTVLANSAQWAEQADVSELAAASADWNSAFETLQASSGDWEDTRSTVLANSADWADHTDISDLEAASGNWNSTYETLQASSGDWNDARSTVAANSGDWINDENNLILVQNISTDHTFNGISFSASAGENLALGDVCYMASGGKYWKADASAITTMPGVVMATETINADAVGTFLKQGFIRDDSWNWTVGAWSGMVYVHTTGGNPTQTAPSGPGDIVQVLGYAVASDILYFEPALTIIELT